MTKKIKSFLSNVSKYLKLNGKIITAFSEIVRGYNDPRIHAEKYGLIIKELASFDAETGKRFIYELRKK